MNNFTKLDRLLRQQSSPGSREEGTPIHDYARAMSVVENVVAVVSDLKRGTSRIFNGRFAERIGISGYSAENSIWEKRILALMPPQEQEAKFLSELRFFHYLRRIGKARRNCYLMTKLRFDTGGGEMVNVLHRMYYVYDGDTDSVAFAICLYGPLTVDFKGRSIVVNSMTGICEEITSSDDSTILSTRERQVLTLIDSGMKSAEIAERLHISKHTVSRHRQEILSRLQVKNSIEACRLAKSLRLI